MKHLSWFILAIIAAGLSEVNLARAEGDFLRLVSKKPLPQPADYTDLSLTGINKPNGRIYRFREYQPSDMPEFIQQMHSGLQLSIADQAGAEGWFCLYRGSFPDDNTNANFKAVLYSHEGKTKWAVNLNRYLSSEKHLEIQDIHYSGGLIFFNEACQSYSKGAKGQCSFLVCLDPVAQQVKWRTGPLVSNNIFILTGKLIICGYGFTDEPDALYVIDASDGTRLQKLPLDSAHDYLEIQGDRLLVTTYKSYYVFNLMIPERFL